MSKEMLGGCCVCSDERGWTENPLVYCDGQGCTVAVHQACYGIVTVPTGPWFCRKCESQERSARVRCELCPSKDGALKRTDNSGWAHVVCALYIPEVRFGNVTTMEPIILQLIPTERFSKVCYLCQEQGKGAKSTVGACMQCNKTGCKLQFHVTCAQALGLLCEEAGNYLDNVKYCGYCQHHYSKLKKGGNVKTIPPYKPISAADNGSSDSSPEKDSESLTRMSSGKKKLLVAAKPNISGIKSKSHSPAPSPTPETLSTQNSALSSIAGDQAGADNEPVTLKIGTTSSHSYQLHDEHKKKFTTSNFVESVITQGESVFSVFSNDKAQADGKTGTGYNNSKKRKVSAGSLQLQARNADGGTTDNANTATSSANTSTNNTNPTSNTTSTLAGLTVNIKNPTVNITNLKTNVISSTGKSTIQSVPLTVTSLASTTTTTTTTDKTQQQQQDANTAGGAGTAGAAGTADVKPVINDTLPAKRARSTSSEKGRKNRRSGGAVQSKRVGRSSSGSSSNLTTELNQDHIKDSPPDSPVDERKLQQRKKANQPPPPAPSSALPVVKTEDRDIKPFQNGANVPHMLGNQLNPSSMMAQRMHDSLNQEIEAHSIFNSEPAGSTNLVGPQLPSKVIAAVRPSVPEKTSSPTPASVLSSTISSAGSGSSTTTNSQPQSLDQLLERQWEQGSQFLMEQAQHFDIASLLSCLHQLKAENLKLEESVNSLLQRRDHLLAVNARLAVPLTTQPATTQANQPTTPVSQLQSNLSNSRISHSGVFENGLGNDTSNYPVQQTHNRGVGQASPAIRHNPSQVVYTTQGGAGSGGSVVRTTNVNMDQRRQQQQQQQTNYSGYHGQVPVVTSPSMNIRRDDLHSQM